MNLRQPKWIALGLVAALWGCKREAPPAPAAPRALAEIVATCAVANGAVTTRRAGAAYWEKVDVGTAFRLADWVRTGEQSTARIAFLEGGGIVLEPKALVVIDRPAAIAPGEKVATRVTVEEGGVSGYLGEERSSGELLAPLVFKVGDQEVTLAPGGSGARTEFRLERREGRTEVAVLSGEATLQTKAGAVALSAGQFTGIAADGRTEIPEELIDFPRSESPGVDARFRNTGALTIALSWSEVPDANGYRVQIARDLSFQELVATVDTTERGYAFSPGANGMFAWRVAARDAQARLGEFGFARRVYVEVEQPRDLLVGPRAGAVVKVSEADPLVFTWQSAGVSDSYRFVLAKEPDLLRAPVEARSVQAQQVELAGLEPGEYYWGTFVERDERSEPIFLSPRKLIVRRAGKVKVTAPKAIKSWGG